MHDKKNEIKHITTDKCNQINHEEEYRTFVHTIKNNYYFFSLFIDVKTFFICMRAVFAIDFGFSLLSATNLNKKTY